MTALFSHLDRGTPETVWRADGRISTAPGLDADLDAIVVVAAHPDDETLGAAGIIRRVAATGGAVTVIVATDGEASHPDSPTRTPQQLAAARRKEVKRAVGHLDSGADVRFLGILDGGIREAGDRLADAVAEVLDVLSAGDRRRVAVFAPWSGDRHRDHRAAAEAVARVCGVRGIPHYGYPIWLWHWGAPGDVPWHAARGLELTRSEAEAKRKAVALHVTQVRPLSGAAGDEAIVGLSMRGHFERGVELFLDERPASLGAGWFDDFYRTHDDPWGFETRWYEERKRSILMSSLPDARLGVVLELGCATGLLTRELAVRADRVVALDPAEQALDAARARIRDLDEARVEFVRGGIPGDFPEGSFDTVVLSEVGYYLDRADLARTIALIEECLTDRGCLIACHWLHPVEEYPLTGAEVHEALHSSARWEAIVRHEEADFLLEVFAPIPAASVAQREGIA